MKNYRNRLFLANHGKRSAPWEIEHEEDPDEVMDDEELSKYFGRYAPSGFFFMPKMPKPVGRSWGLFGKRNGGRYGPSIQILNRPNGFMLPSIPGKRSSPEVFMRPNGFLLPSKASGSYLAMHRRNPNGFNFPLGKRSEAPAAEEDFIDESAKRDFDPLDFDGEADFFGQRGKRSSVKDEDRRSSP